MKITKLFLLLTLIFISAKCIAGDTNLQLSLYDDGEFTVTLDNAEFYDAGNVAELENLQAGEHYLKVVRVDTRVPVNENIVFEGKIKIPAGLNVYAVIDEYNTFSIYKKVPLARGRCKLKCDYYKYCEKRSSGERHEEHHEENYTDECRYKIMSESDFKDFKGSIGNRNFESTNLTIAKSVLDKNMVSSQQVKDLLGYFTFESNKLELAKYAYNKTCDKQNYFKVYDAFSFDSSIEELKNYISGK
jgi:hypothetical protein